MRSSAQCRFLLQTYSHLLDGLSDEDRAVAPDGHGKTAGWIVGHLAVTGDFARRLCGATAICPADWRPLFNPGTKPSTNEADYPPMEELVAKLREVYTDLPRAFDAASEEQRRSPNPYEPGRDPFATAGEFAEYLMTGHFGYHLGQFSGWRDATR
jgi:hypothetical protein